MPSERRRRRGHRPALSRRCRRAARRHARTPRRPRAVNERQRPDQREPARRRSDASSVAPAARHRSDERSVRHISWTVKSRATSLHSLFRQRPGSSTDARPDDCLTETATFQMGLGGGARVVQLSGPCRQCEPELEWSQWRSYYEAYVSHRSDALATLATGVGAQTAQTSGSASKERASGPKSK